MGDGLTIQGTTTTDKLFAETVTQDALTAIGIVKTDSGIVFSQGSLEFSGTAMTSDSETLVLTDTLGGAYTYNIDVTGTVDFVNSSISAAGVVDYNFDSSGATSFSMTGGSLSNYLSLTTGAAQVMSGVVFQAGGTAAIANDLTDSAFNQCGVITLTGSLTGVVVDKNTAASAVLTDDIGDITGCPFTSDGTGHAVELSSIGGGTMSWDNTESGYAAIDGSTGNETIYVNVAAGSLTINVVAGASTPTIRTAGATVTVVAGLKTLTIQTQDGVEVRIRQGSFTIQHTQNVTGGQVTYTYSFVADTNITISVGGAGFLRQSLNYTLIDGDAILLFDLENDPSYLT